ncbi:80 kd mcm3-associated protein [Ophiostoma piceae UAMH 11346]|uniref:80 kd mcm3-associated protein n=1 Tax=Ophiostoma piceae (strain UAMH 11346) TaxID=1262450 RepID=S3CUA0_OPHP1|nr:80 kd mcm3-associated protein [Ophiostoma piceae UAMH 11346]
MAYGQQQLAPGTMATNMFGKAPPPAGNPFGAQASATPAAANPFLAKAAGAPTASNPFGQPSGLGAAAAPNPFQAAVKANTAATANPAQRAASPFSMFGQPSQALAPANGTQAPTPSPFQAATLPVAGQPFSAPAAPSTSSPFGGFSGAGTNGLSSTAPAAANRFQANSTPSPFGAPSPFGSTPTSTAAPSPFGGAAVKPAAPSPFGGASTTPAPSQLDALASAKAAARKSVHFNSNPVSSTAPAYSSSAPSNGPAKPKQNSFARFTPKAPAPLVQNQTATQDEYTKKILGQLQKDRINPPQWPADPGNPNKASAMDGFWSSYDNYRTKARDSLVKAGLIDNPNIRKKLNEAIDFKGICEDMCPEFEKIERIYQHNVMMAEKTESPDGTMWPSPSIMVKALTRSSAGQEAPLPMDVRTVASLKRTLDYLIDNVLGEESRLPLVHNFLWDRTRAIRRDFIFHSTMSEEEMQGQIYCLEVITRFHVTCLHLLSQKGLAPEGFDQLQERIQLSKALLSLLQAYDDCKDRQIKCSNEAEFRAYFILLNAQDPNFQHRVSEWGTNLWYDSDEVQTAMTLAQTMQSVWDWRGPGRPAMPTTTALGAFSTFFRIVESPQVSYTMACFAEAQFMHVRRGILRNMVRAYARTRDTPKDLTVAALNNMLRFDTVDEAWEFVKTNGLEFSSEDKSTAYLDLTNRPTVSNEPLPQAFSKNLVERKRAGRSLPDALHTTVFEAPGTAPPVVDAEPKKNESDLFVSQTPTPTLAPMSAPTNFGNAFGKPPAAAASAPSTSIFGSTTAAKPTAQAANPATSIFSSASSSPSPAPSPAPRFFPASSQPVKKEAAPSLLFQAAPDSKRKASDNGSTTPTTSPAKTAATSNLFGLGATQAESPLSFQPPAATTSAPSFFSQIPSTASTTPSSTHQAIPGPQPPTTSSFSSLFPSSTPSTTTPADTKTTTPAAPVLSNVFSAGTTPTPADTSSSSLFSGATTSAPSLSSTHAFPNPFGAGAASSTALPKAAGKLPEISQNSLFSASAPPPPQQPAPSKNQLMDSFNKWFVLGDTGILGEFKEGFIEYLVKETFNKYQHDEAERIKREEDEKSWEEAIKFKTYNLSVKFFYKWRRIARERALDRRARQARDELKAYRAAKRIEQRKAAEQAAVEERERAIEARRMASKEVKLLEELGYTEFTTAARKRKALADNERLRSVSMSAVGQHPHQHLPQQQHYAPHLQDDATPSEQPQHEFQKPRLPHKLPVRAIKDGISNTVSRAKEFVSSRIASSSSKRHHRTSYGDGDSVFDDGASMSGESVRSTRSIRSNFSRVSRDSIGSNTNTSTVTYYRRSVPGKSRMHSIFTRVPSGSSTGAAEPAPPPKKITNFMRYSKNAGVDKNQHQNPSQSQNQRWGSPSSFSASTSRRPATATAAVSPSPSDRPSFSSSMGVGSNAGSGFGSSMIGNGHGIGAGNGSKVKSSYWRLRAMGMVQMPNKQYLHESLALPMLQDGKRFPGVGNYGLPPVPTWDDAMDANKNAEMVDVHDDGDDDDDDDARTETYAEEIMRRTMVPSSSLSPAGALSRKRVFSGSTEAVNAGGADVTAGNPHNKSAIMSPPGVKKARVEASGTAASSDGQLTEAERVIREMRELAAAMDEDRDWFKEQTELLQKGVSAWD